MATKFKREFKNVVLNYSDAEAKVREATSNDPWGPSSALMSELAEYTFHVQAYSLVMGMLWKRLNDSGKNWRHVYKSLTVLEYLIKAGSDRVTQQCKDNLFSIQTLKDFQFVDKEGKDQGVNVREKAKHIVALLKDESRLKEERARAQQARERKAHISSDDVAKYPRQAPAKKVQFSEASPEEASAPPANPGKFEQNVEQARPTDTSEEELQLKLALQLSKEQADKDEELRKQEEESLKAALALSEADNKPETSEEEPPANDLLLDLEASGGVQGAAWVGGEGSVPAEPPPSYDIVTALADPWAAGGAPQITSQDPFAPQTSSSTSAVAAPLNFDPWAGIGSSATSSVGQPQPILTDPWSSLPPATSDGSSSLQPTAGTNSSSINPFDLSSLGIPPLQPSPKVSPRGSPTPDRVENKFLGENAALVDLDLLAMPAPTKSTTGGGSSPSNPFGGSPMTSLSANPFQAGKPPAPTLNQLATVNQPLIGGPADLLPPPLIPAAGGSPILPRQNPFQQQPVPPSGNQSINPFS